MWGETKAHLWLRLPAYGSARPTCLKCSGCYRYLTRRLRRSATPPAAAAGLGSAERGMHLAHHLHILLLLFCVPC